MFHYYYYYYYYILFLTPWSRVLQKLPGFQLLKFPNFMEPEGSLPHLQVPAACPYSEPDQSTACPHPTL